MAHIENAAGHIGQSSPLIGIFHNGIKSHQNPESQVSSALLGISDKSPVLTGLSSTFRAHSEVLDLVIQMFIFARLLLTSCHELCSQASYYTSVL